VPDELYVLVTHEIRSSDGVCPNAAVEIRRSNESVAGNAS
jgi:hypothetical protein